jgi:hypothetical protein
MPQRVYDVLLDGSEVLVAVNLLPKPVDFDLSQEGLGWTKQDRDDWRRAKYNELLPTLVPLPGKKKVYKYQDDKLYASTWCMDGMPRVGHYKPSRFSPIFEAFLKRLEPYVSREKVVLIRRKMWGIRTGQHRGTEVIEGKGSRGVFLSILAYFVSVQDLHALGEALFMYSIDDAVRLDDVEVPEILRPLFNICSRVDGRGEVLAAFLFKDIVWLPGTGKHDLESEDALIKYHVKEIQGSKIRMGGTKYAASEVSTELLELSKDPAWVQVGKADVRYSLSKRLLKANEALLIKRYGSVNAFWERVNNAFQASEQDTKATVFFNVTRVVVRLMCDVLAVGATKGDFEVLPQASSTNDLADVAAQ